MSVRTFPPPPAIPGKVAHRATVLKPAELSRGTTLMGYLLIMVFFLLPAYVFPSGGYQLVDIALLLTIAIVYFSGKLPVDFDNKLIFSLLPFVIWVFIINLVYFIIYMTRVELFMTIAITYGFVLLYIFTIIFIKLLNEKTLKYVYLSLLLSIVGCFLFTGMIEEGMIEEGRASLSFNNPNQLAYFAAILLCYGIMLMQFKIDNHIKNKLFTFFDILIILMAHLLTLVALSRAGVVVVLFLDMILLLNVKNIQYIFPIIFISIISIVLLVLLKPDFVQKRLAVRSLDHFTPQGMVHDDGLLNRVVKPLRTMQGLEFIYGSGAGASARFLAQEGAIKREKTLIEVHNTYAAILRSYGIIGFALFCFWYVRFIWNSRKLKYGLWIMAAIFAFNSAHLGLRFRSFWIFMAFFTAIMYLQHKRDSGDIENSNKKIKLSG